MNAPETIPARQTVPVAGSVQRSWPWHLFVVLVVLGAAVLATHQLLKPPLALSLPSLSFRSGGCSAEFEAVNNTDQQVKAVVQVIFGFFSDSDTGTSYQELARTEVPIALLAKQRKNVTCDFLLPNPTSFLPNFPNAVRVEITSYHPQIHEPAN